MPSSKAHYRREIEELRTHVENLGLRVAQRDEEIAPLKKVIAMRICTRCGGDLRENAS